MGLDLVEMVCTLESEFEITIHDEITVTLTTPRAVISYLLSREEVSQKWSKEYVSLSVWMIIENELAVDRKDFNDDSRFVEDMGAG